ncbi:T9SS type A sorting domain-containing protein [Epilithonimonas vandammei]|uniref:T9SS type A sorting domain-containing protein n=1 Tax=Epilithonimonas vandammei TaxID=2487072 RepID=UPI00289E0949|nr:T9SS type A sorting domain-containing protein [Epilithonimonas vandammei]
MGFSIITYKAQTTVWNGSSWSNGTPNSNTDVIINGNYFLNTNLSSKNLTINPGFTYAVKNGQRLLIYGNFTNNGKLYLENDAILTQVSNNSVYSGTGTATVERQANLKRKDYNYWSAPVQGQNIYNFSIGTPTKYFFKYNEKDDKFYADQINTNSIFEPAIGYAIRGKNSYALTTPTTETFLFSGIPNNGTYSKVLQRSVGSDKGYNLIGNPYPSNFNLAAFAKAKTNRNSLVGKFWFWSNINQVTYQQGSSYAGNNYATYVVDVGGIGPTYVSGSTEEIALRPSSSARVAQGFIVQAKYNDAPISFTNAMRASSNSSSVIFYNKNEEEDEPEDPEPIIDRYWLKLINPDNIANDILIAHIAEATNNYDEDYDAALFTMGNDTFYSVVGTNKLQIQARALPISDSDVIPLAYKTSKAGNCIIVLNDKDGIFKDSDKAIYLKDKVTGAVTNLQEGYYTFNSEVLTTPNESRFEILYTNEVLAAGAVTKEDLLVYKQNETLVIKNNFNISKAELYDASGKLMTSLSGNNTKEIKLSTIGFVRGVYILKITSEKGITTKKVIL